MKHPKGIWLRRGLLPYYLTGHRLALALLLRDKPSTAAQLAAALTEKGYRTTPQTLEKSLARLTRLGIVSVSDSVYRCTCEKLDAAPIFGVPAPRPGRHDPEHRKRHCLLHHHPAPKRQLPRPQRLLIFL